MPRHVPPPPIPPHIARLSPYHPGKPIAEVEREYGLTDVVKLASNENALGPSPAAIEAIRAHAHLAHLYPEGGCPDLRSALSRHLGVGQDEIVFGNGSDEIIHFLGLAFIGKGDRIVQGAPTFSRYEAAGLLGEADCVSVPLRDWRYDLEAIASSITPDTRVVFVANPNNPTGSYVTHDEVERLVDRLPDTCILCLDEAYFEFVDAADYPDGVQLVRDRANVIVLRTFSKLYGLAGLRIGYGIARPEIVQAIEQVREPFNVNHLAQAAALAALSDHDHAARSRAMVIEGRQQLSDGLRSHGLVPWPTQANFVWVDVGRPAKAVYEALLRQGVIVRAGDAFGAPTFLRVTIGTRDQNARLLDTLRRVLQS